MPRELIFENRYHFNGRILEGFLFSDRTFVIRYEIYLIVVRDTIDEHLDHLPPKELTTGELPDLGYVLSRVFGGCQARLTSVGVVRYLRLELVPVLYYWWVG